MIIVPVSLSTTVNTYAPHTSTTAVIIFARLAGDVDMIAASSSYSMFHIVDVRGVSSLALTAKAVERMLTRSASTWGSARNFSLAVLRTAVKKMLNSIGARTQP